MGKRVLHQDSDCVVVGEEIDSVSKMEGGGDGPGECGLRNVISFVIHTLV